MERWQSFAKVTATIVTAGELWGMKVLVQDQSPRQMTVWLHEERASVQPFGGPDRRTAFTPERIAIETMDGTTVAERLNPRESFSGHQQRTPWDPLHRAYFNGYALWTYLTSPFHLIMSSVEVTEGEAWKEGAETWRRLCTHYPNSLATHCDVQEFFFDKDLKLRRHDYNVDVAGGFAAAQYVYDYIEADGIKLPSRRRAYQRGPDGHAINEPLMVSIDISDVHFS